MSATAVAKAEIKSCTICTRQSIAKQLCRKHYMQVFRHGKLLPPSEEHGFYQQCKEDECGLRPRAHGLCAKHYQRSRRNKETESLNGKHHEPDVPASNGTLASRCVSVGCKSFAVGRELCRLHYICYWSLVSGGACTWGDVDVLILTESENELFTKKRIELIKERQALVKHMKASKAADMPEMAAQEPLYEDVDLVDDEISETEFERYLGTLDIEGDF